MIKITKPGQKEFHGFCKWCGCEFTYEISDLKLSATSDKLSCPTCGKDYHHPSMVQDPPLPSGIGYQWPSDSTDPCAGCVWRENLLRDGLYVGDTPCTWCNKNKFNSITCDQASIKDYTTPAIAELDSYLTTTSGETSSTYTTAYNSSDRAIAGGVVKAILDCCEAYSPSNATNTTVYSPKDTTSTIPAPPTSGSNAVKSCNSCSGEHKCAGKKNSKGKR